MIPDVPIPEDNPGWHKPLPLGAQETIDFYKKANQFALDYAMVFGKRRNKTKRSNKRRRSNRKK